MPSDQRPFRLMKRSKTSILCEIVLLFLLWCYANIRPEEWSVPALTALMISLLALSHFWRMLPVLNASKQDK